MFGLSWLPNWDDVFRVLLNGWRDLVNVDFGKIQYSDAGFALWTGLAIAAIGVFKLILILAGRKKYARAQSGLFISAGRNQSVFVKLLRVLPKLALIVPLLAIFIAMTDPFLASVKEEKKLIETRTRIDIRDASGSMTGIFQGTGKSKSEVATEAHLKFLKMRQGKGDRTSYYLFGTEVIPVVEGFITDDELYYFQVYDAPIGDQGGTMLSPALKVAIHLFDEDEEKQKKSPYYKKGTKKAIIIITDAAIYDINDVANDFPELSKRKVIPYIIWINEFEGEDNQEALDSIQPLLDLTVAHGGKFFPVSGIDSLDQAYAEIDRLEKTKAEVTKKNLKTPVFQEFVFIALITLPLIIIAGLLIEMFFVPYP